MGEKSLWFCIARTYWKSLLWNLSEICLLRCQASSSRGKTSWSDSTMKPPKKGVRWCYWPLPTTGACFVGNLSSCSPLFPLLTKLARKKRRLKGSDSFSQCRQQKVNLELKDSKLVTGTGNISKHFNEDALLKAVVLGQLGSHVGSGKITSMSYTKHRINSNGLQPT